MKRWFWPREENLTKETKKWFLGWLDEASFIPLFSSMCVVKILDVFFAYATYLVRPSIFVTREANPLLLNAIAYGEVFPFLLVEALIYLQLGVIAAGIVKLKEYEGELPSLAFAIPLTSLGLLTLCLYPVSMGSNMVNGLLALNVIKPISALLYVVAGFPIGWATAKYGWKFQNPYVPLVMLAAMLVIGFQI